MSGKSHRNRSSINQLRVREETVSANESNKPGTSVIVQQPQQASPNIDVMAYRLEQNELATRELKHEMTEGFKSIKNQITEFTNNFATHAQVKELEIDLLKEVKRVEDGAAGAIETLSTDIAELKTERLNLLKSIAKWTVAGLALMLLGLYGINQFF